MFPCLAGFRQHQNSKFRQNQKLNLEKLVKKMGIQSFFSDLKDKLQGQSNKEKAPPLPPPQAQNLGEEIRLMVNSAEFKGIYNVAAPFLFASLGAWPGYWAFRAMDYHVHRSHIPLEIYIKQTYYQAKAVQLLIILAGTYTVIRNQKLLMAQNVQNSQVKGHTDL